MAESVIVAKNLYKIYDLGETKVRALNGVDLDVPQGCLCAIFGTSGSGKSTLLNMLAGLEKPTKGNVTIAKGRIDQMNESQLAVFRQKHIGFIFQSYNLMQNMTALENVALPLTFQGVPKEERKIRAAKMLKMVGLGKHMEHRPGQLSGGQQQRVGIARALVVKPEIIFADEPTGNLDSATTLEVMAMMQKLTREKGQTIVMVTHDNSIASYADMIVKLIDGKIVSTEYRAVPVQAQTVIDSETADSEGKI
ncbi:MAG: ABC transporter ATP-binding protein [Lachnospiraceae bacterium]|nr:ABC transporter ATP-binding protein [Lachnospiraceae bacterium]